MSGYVDWIGAAADDPDPDALKSRPPFAPGGERSSREESPEPALLQELPRHNFPAQLHVPDEEREEDPLDRNPDLWMYRKRTVALLRRYWRFSLETGRLPSFVGREFFRTKVTCYAATTFEDRVIFVRDVEKSLERLEYWDQQLLARIIFLALDLLSEDFLRVGLLAEAPSKGGLSR